MSQTFFAGDTKVLKETTTTFATGLPRCIRWDFIEVINQPIKLSLVACICRYAHFIDFVSYSLRQKKSPYWEFFSSAFSRILPEYRDLLCKSLYFVQIGPEF